MGHDALKLELIEWLASLEDNKVIEYLKLVKDSKTSNRDWWDDLSKTEKKGIERGLRDVDNGRTLSHKEIKKRYGI